MRPRIRVRVVCGEFWGRRGPVDGIAADPIYLDISVPPGRRKVLPDEALSAEETARIQSLLNNDKP